MTDEKLAHYYFLPYLRGGLATLIADTTTTARAKVNIPLQAVGVNSELRADIDPPGGVELYGPGDVLGFDEGVITRREPERDVSDREPNYFPLIEFGQPDFPWRFNAGPENGKLEPWITLIVLKAEGSDKEFDDGCNLPNLPKPKTPCITVKKIGSLPNLAESWRWAHVQMTTDEPLDPTKDLDTIIQNEPDGVVSRLVCARRLAPGTLYHAFVVPTFKLGALAGLGFDIDHEESALDLAWESDSSMNQDPRYSNGPGLALPYYYRWAFRTGLRGDFETLVRRLEPRKLTGLGRREVDCSTPGYELPAVKRTDESGNESHTLGLEGALMSWRMKPTKWGHDSETWSPSEEQQEPLHLALANLLRQPKADLVDGTTTPTVGPPIYGRWHAARDEVEPSKKAWLNVLNLDPRHRMVAAFGTEVVQRQQEELMASAWDQVGAIDEANEILRRAQLGRESSLPIFRQRLQPMSVCDLIRITSPVHARVLMGPDNASSTVRHHFSRSRVPLAALDPAFRRLWRRGPVRRRQKQDQDLDRKDILERLNDGTLCAAGPAPDPDGALRICQTSFELLKEFKILEQLYPAEDEHDPNKVIGELNLFCEENLSCALFKDIPGCPDFTGDPYEEWTGHEDLIGDDSDAAVQFRKFLLVMCEELEPSEAQDSGRIDLDQVRATLIEALDPRKTIVSRTRARLHIFDVVEQADPLDPIMAAPEFDKPMYEPLNEISQDLILPGLASVPQNTIALVKTNGRFVESYMVGLNHEMARELLWREYPTDQRGSYFRQFWDVSNVIPSQSDLAVLEADVRAKLEEAGIEISDDLVEEEVEARLEEKFKDVKPLHEWRENLLGANDNRPPAATNGEEENVVLLIRGDLLRKYPNTRIYAVESKRIPDGAGDTKRVPGLPEHLPKPPEDKPEEEWPEESRPGQQKDPILSGQLPPDVTFFGFDLTPSQAEGTSGENPDGWFFVIEERISEARFGMDTYSGEDLLTPAVEKRDALTWGHVPSKHNASNCLQDGEYLDSQEPGGQIEGRQWGESSASIAWITVQKPVRISIHASKMIPERESEQ